MSKHRLVTAVAAGLLAGVAQLAHAADLELPYQMARVSNWTGCYGGVHVGVNAMQDTWTAALANGVEFWAVGFLGGGQFGCNYQLGRFVVGLESEIWGSSIKSEKNFADFAIGTKVSTANPWDSATSGRAGFAFDDVFVYLKGGVVVGGFSYKQTSTGGFASAGSAVNTGALLGLGFEYAFAPLWTAKVETDVALFSTTKANIANTGLGNNATQMTISETQILFKIGVNRRFTSDFSLALD